MARMQSEKKKVERWKDVERANPGKSKPKKMSHKELLMKWTRDGSKFGPPKKVWTKADIDRKREAEAAARMREAAGPEMQDAGQIDDEDEDETPDMVLKASDLARARMSELAEEMQLQALQGADAGGSGAVSETAMSPEDLQIFVDCRRSQLEELEMLEAMFPEEFCPLYNATVDELRASLEAEGAEALRSHPQLELLLQMTVPDERPPGETGDRRLIASILLHIVFPSMYPTPGTSPEFRIEDVMIADALKEIGSEEAHLDLKTEIDLNEEKFIAEMQQMAEDIQPEPCVYAIVSWMQENTFLHLA